MYGINTLAIYSQLLKTYDLSHKIISENINNVNTPRFKAKELDSSAFAEILNSELNAKKRLEMKITSPLHIKPSNDAANNAHVSYRTEGVENKINGNNVVLSHETLNLSENSTSRSQALSAYNNFNRIISSAVNGKGQ